MLAFNSSRPLFRNNPALRRAVNFALDRKALQAIGGGPLAGRVTDQYMPPLVPGFATGTSIHWSRPTQSAQESWRAATSGVARPSSIRATSASLSPSRNSRSSSSRRSGSRSRSSPCRCIPAAQRTSTSSPNRVRTGTSRSSSGRRTCPTRRPISTCCWTAITSAEPTSPGSRRRPTTVRFAARRGCRRLVNGSSRTARWMYRLRATPRRSPRSASSTSRHSSPNASAASFCDRRSF